VADDPSSYVAVDGRRLEYRWVGPDRDEPTLVFLHEGLGSVALWHDVPARLSAATSRRALVYSRAGHGRSDPVDGPRPVDYMHHEALVVLPALLEDLDVERPILVGHSDGASIALIATGTGAVTARALVLLAPHVFVEERSIAGITAARRAYATSDLPARMAKYHRDVDATFRGWNDVWLSSDFRTWSIESYLPGVAVPLLVIQGEDDEYGTSAQLDAIEAGTAGSVERMELAGCRHAPHLEAGDATLAAIARFVSSVGG
jgi:pimeloyl-ACP methyl ester carboxylesterase